MAEAIRDRDVPTSGPIRSTGAPALANGAALRWTPGPDELRLPSCEDEHVPQNTRQLVVLVDCFDTLQRHWRGRPDVFVGSDQFVHWDPAYDSHTNPGNPPVAPDAYVAFGVANRHRSSYVAWEEGKPPDFVLEVVSPSSRERDAEEKLDIYARMGVPEFFLYDPDGKRGPALSGFELREGAYRPLPEERLPGGATGVRSEVLGLCLCIGPPGPEPLDDFLRWYDPAAGEFLATRHELADGKRRAEEEATVFKASAAESEAMAEASEARAEASDARAEASEARAKASEAKVAELEALIEKMRSR